MGCPEVRGGAGARVIIQRRHPHDDVRLMPTLRHQMRAAARAEMPEFTRRRFKGRQQLRALSPAKVLTHHAGCRYECRRMHLAAAVAVAVADGHVEAVYLVAHAFAEATSIQWVSHNVLPVQGWGHHHCLQPKVAHYLMSPTVNGGGDLCTY